MNRFCYGCFFIAMVLCWHSGKASKGGNFPTNDTLRYTYRTIKRRAVDCGNQPDSSCTVALVKYPLFNDKPVLNDSISSIILKTTGDDSGKYKRIDEALAGFLKGYELDRKKNASAVPYTLNVSAKVLPQGKGFLVIQTDKYSYSGGAHGGSYETYLNWNVAANKKITLDDLFINGYKERLTKIAENIFRKQEKLKDTASLANNYFFEGNKFSLNKNFRVTPNGLVFLYNEYEIKSYAEGVTRLLIPYTQIKSLLKPNTVLNQYIR